MTIKLDDYRPGKGYKVREYLGSGAWKSAFVGSAPGQPEEVALLCYQAASRADAADDLSKLIKLDSQAPYSEYLAALHAIFNGEDSRLWIAEELLVSPLSKLGKLYDVGKFTRIARDLSRGLKCIHDQGYVHRDMKLDNCGISYNRAKIFDLGSLVTEPGPIACTIITRAPEFLIDKKPDFQSSGDVWALGATLFALCTGDYPFVLAKEVRERAEWNEAAAEGRTTHEEVRTRKSAMDDLVIARASEPEAESRLRDSVLDLFGGEVADLLIGMLAFETEASTGNGTMRLTIEEAVEGWGRLAGNYAGTQPLIQHIGQWERVQGLLEAVRMGKIAITHPHLKRVNDEWSEAKRQKGAKFPFKSADFERLLTDVRNVIDKRHFARQRTTDPSS